MLKENLVYFGPMRSYTVHFGSFQSILFTLVLFSSFGLIQSNLVLFGPFDSIQFNLVHFNLFDSVHFNQSFVISFLISCMSIDCFYENKLYDRNISSVPLLTIWLVTN